MRLTQSLLLAGLGGVLLTQRAGAEDLQVTVVAAPLKRAPRDETAASSVISRDELQRPGATAGSVLQRVPGVQIQRSGGSSDLATASLRGTSSAQLPVYLGGIRLNDDVTGTADLSTIPLYAIERVEIYRGHAPNAADRLGIGGAILFEPRLPHGPELRAGQRFGSYGEHSTELAVGFGDAKIGSLVSLRRSGARNDYPYLDDRGTRFDASDDVERRRPNSDVTTTDLFALGRWNLSTRSRVTWLYSGLAREQGVTGLAVRPAQHTRVDVARQLFGATWTSPCAPGVVSCQVTVESTALLARSRFHDPLLELGLGSTELHQSGQRFSERLRVEQQLGERSLLGLVAGVASETLELQRPDDATRHARRVTSTLGGQGKLGVGDSLQLVGLGRLDHETTDALSGTQSAPNLVGRLGARWHPIEQLEVFSNLGHAVRSPTLGELYGTSALVVGNPELAPEASNGFDLGALVTQRLAGWSTRFEVFGFAQQVSQLITWRRSSFGEVRPYNVGKARLLGVEGAFGVGYREHLRFDQALTFLDARDVTPERTLQNDILPFRARWVASSSADLRFSPERLIEQWGLTLRLFRRGARYAVPAGDVMLPGLTTVDVEGRIRPKCYPIWLRAAVVNLLDQQAQDLVGMPLPGRTYHVGLEYAWEGQS